jgi:hypothetical protein
MEFTIKSEYEINDIVNLGGKRGAGKILDITIEKDGKCNYKIKYLFELSDRSRIWLNENKVCNTDIDRICECSLKCK